MDPLAYDASGNPVTHDDVVAPPGRLQWIAGPRFMRSHEHVPGIYSVVSSNGRIFYILDESQTYALRATPRWCLVARDAFNGTLLWKQSISEWFPHIVCWGNTPRQLQRKLVAVGDRVYVTLGLHAPLSAVDAATGKLLQTYDDTRGAEEIILHDGTLLAMVRTVTKERIEELDKWARLVGLEHSEIDNRDTAEPLVKRLRSTESKGQKTILAFDAESGQKLLALLKTAAHPENVDTLAPLAEQLQPSRWNALVPANDNAGQQGDPVFIVGNPFKVAQGNEPLSVMRGIIGGRCRLDAFRDTQPFPYRGEVLLLDAVTSNPGSPGSPVIDNAGQWVGLIGEIVTSRLTNTYLNYAYPASELRAFLDEAQSSATPASRPAASVAAATGPGYHGIRLSKIAYRRALPFVRSVTTDSPAERAGLKPDDLIISANGQAITQARVFEELCDRLHPGDELSLTVKRGDVLVPIRFILTEPPQ